MEKYVVLRMSNTRWDRPWLPPGKPVKIVRTGKLYPAQRAGLPKRDWDLGVVY
jgi:hypothetical protein